MALDGSDYHALVVDDDPDVRRTLSRALRNLGFSCNTASDGEMARKDMIVHPPDLLVTDLRMPVRHGHRLVVETMERSSPPLVVVVTGLVEPAIAYDIIARGVLDVTLKPFDAGVCAAKWLAMLQHRKTLSATIASSAVPAAASPDPAGKSPAQSEDSVAEQLERTTIALRGQLKEITANFEETIGSLEKQHANLTAGFLGSIRLLTQLMRKFDGAESTHAARVERLAEGICESLRADRDMLRNVRLGSLLHDLGQFGMPDSVRVTPVSKMTARQRDAYRHYPEIGATLLSEVKGCEQVVDLVLAHAEHFDGNGFPKQLSGKGIPLGARIIRIADGIDTFLMEYEDEDAEEKLSAHLIAEREHQYDPEILDASFEFLLGFLKKVKTVECSTRELRVGDILEEDLLSPLGHIIARRGATVNATMKTYVERILGDTTIRVQRSD